MMRHLLSGGTLNTKNGLTNKSLKMNSVTWDQVRSRRLDRNGLTRRAPICRLEKVVGDLCGFQAQVLSAAELAIGLRVEGATQRMVREAIWERKSLVKTYGPRRTIHLFPSRELNMWMAGMRTVAGLDGKAPDAITAAVLEVLSGNPLGRRELAVEVGRRVGSQGRDALSSTWGADSIKEAAYRGKLCFGPSRGSRVTFVRVDQWVSDELEWEGREALEAIILRYASTYGPVTPRHFANWIHMNPDTVQEIFEDYRDSLDEIDTEGETGWVPRNTTESEWQRTGESVFLLPRYDPYVLNSLKQHMSKRNDARNVLPETHRRRIFSYKMGRLEGAVGIRTLLVNGRVGGMWAQGNGSKCMEIRVEPFERLTRELLALLKEQVERIGAFYERSVRLEIGRLDG